MKLDKINQKMNKLDICFFFCVPSRFRKLNDRQQTSYFRCFCALLLSNPTLKHDKGRVRISIWSRLEICPTRDRETAASSDRIYDRAQLDLGNSALFGTSGIPLPLVADAPTISGTKLYWKSKLRFFWFWHITCTLVLFCTERCTTMNKTCWWF